MTATTTRLTRNGLLPQVGARKLERYPLRVRMLHTGVYLTTFMLLGTGGWLLAGREGDPSPLARVLSAPDTSIHTWLGWVLAALLMLPVVVDRKGLAVFARETLRFDPGDSRWLLRWPVATFSGRFVRHEGHFDPGQRIANAAIVVTLGALVVSGLGLTALHGGPAFVWLLRTHKLANMVLGPLIAGHVIVGLGVLPGYRGVWRSMHFGGQITEETARRIWPAWTERVLAGRERTNPPARKDDL